MPLKKSSSDEAFQENLRKELESGKDSRQAAAIAYAVKRAARKKKKEEEAKKNKKE